MIRRERHEDEAEISRDPALRGRVVYPPFFPPPPEPMEHRA